MTFLPYLATFLVLTGVYYISKPRVRGQYLMLLADLTWLTYSIYEHNWALAIQSAVLLRFALSAIKNWRKDYSIRF